MKGASTFLPGCACCQAPKQHASMLVRSCTQRWSMCQGAAWLRYRAGDGRLTDLAYVPACSLACWARASGLAALAGQSMHGNLSLHLLLRHQRSPCCSVQHSPVLPPIVSDDVPRADLSWLQPAQPSAADHGPSCVAGKVQGYTVGQMGWVQAHCKASSVHGCAEGCETVAWLHVWCLV